MKVKNIKETESRDFVYDIEVNTKDHLYKVGDVITHNCCFSPETPFTFEDAKGNVYSMTMKEYVETRLDETVLGEKETLEKKLPGDDFVRAPGGRIVPITGVIKLKNRWKQLVKVTFEGGDYLWVTPNQEFLLANGELCEARDFTPGSLLYKTAVVKSIDTYDSDEDVYDIEVGSEDHLFKIKLPITGKKVSVSNCRLINNVELFELGGQVNSFGGTALSLGSHRVCTINIRRISLMSASFEDFLKRLGERMEDAADILLAHRNLLKDMIAKGTQPYFDHGWLDLDRMFSTIGIIGYYEANEDLKKKFEDRDYMGDMIDFIDDKARELTIKKHNIYNVEQIPAESMSVKCCKADSWIFNKD